MGSAGGGDAGMSQENRVKKGSNMSPSRHTAEYPTKRIDYNNTYTEDIKTHLIRPGLTYALSVLILNALCVYFFEAFSPLKQFHITKI